MSSAIFFSTISDFLKNRTIYYAFGFGFVFLFLISIFNFPFTIEFSSVSGGAATDLSKYPNLIFYHLFMFYWLFVIAVLVQNNIVEELEDGSLQIFLLDVSKVKYFFTKFIALFLVLLCAIIGNFVLVGIFESNMFILRLISAIYFIPNMLFLMLIVMIFLISKFRKNAALMGIITYSIIAILNVEMVLQKFFFEQMANTLVHILPTNLKLQIMLVNVAFNMETTQNLAHLIGNIFIYICILITVFIIKSRKIEI